MSQGNSIANWVKTGNSMRVTDSTSCCTGIFFFHCLENASDGGQSVYADGLRAVLSLKQEEAEAYHVLASTPVHYADSQPKFRLSCLAPLIEESGNGRILRIRDNPALRCSADWPVPPQDRARWFEAYQEFRLRLEDPNFSAEFKMVPGEVTVFDNWRVFHARRSYQPRSDGQFHRTMAGCYAERSHFDSATTLSRLEVEPTTTQ